MTNPDHFTTGAACVDEMFKLLGCWKRSSYDDNRCSSEIKAFMNCAARQVHAFAIVLYFHLLNKISKTILLNTTQLLEQNITNGLRLSVLFTFVMHLSMLSPGGGRVGGGGDFDILSKIFVKNHSPGTTYFVKKHKNPHPRAGELCQMFLPRGNAIHSRHPLRPNQTKKLYVAKPTKNRNHSSNQLHEVK